MNCNYLAFEGIDGSGKTTLINELSAELSKASVDFKIVREPGGTKLSEGIRDLLLSHDFEVNPTAEALLFSASRAQLIQEVVKPSACVRLELSDAGWRGSAHLKRIADSAPKTFERS